LFVSHEIKPACVQQTQGPALGFGLVQATRSVLHA
jgi:hypothetical protein